MKWLYHCCLMAAFLVLAACTPLQIERTGTVARETVTAADTNQDGRVSNRELKDAKNDPALWIALITGVLGIVTGGAGIARAGSANKLATKVESETDEQWEELKRIQRQPPVSG